MSSKLKLDVRHLNRWYNTNTIQITICNAPYFARRIRGAGMSVPRWKWKNGQQIEWRHLVNAYEVRQAWCLLQVKLCDPCLSALKWFVYHARRYTSARLYCHHVLAATNWFCWHVLWSIVVHCTTTTLVCVCVCLVWGVAVESYCTSVSWRRHQTDLLRHSSWATSYALHPSRPRTWFPITVSVNTQPYSIRFSFLWRLVILNTLLTPTFETPVMNSSIYRMFVLICKMWKCSPTILFRKVNSKFMSNYKIIYLLSSVNALTTLLPFSYKYVVLY